MDCDEFRMVGWSDGWANREFIGNGKEGVRSEKLDGVGQDRSVLLVVYWALERRDYTEQDSLP